MVRFLYVDGTWEPSSESLRPIYLADPDAGVFMQLRDRFPELLPLPAGGVSEGTIVAPAARGALADLVAIVDRLLGPGGCPWDQAQTHESLKRHLLEETYEVFEAIDSGDRDALREELGDLILQPVMHGQISSAAGGFNTEDAARGIVDKLIRRHPHVFGDVSVADADEVLKNWDQIKQTEKGPVAKSILAGVPKGMASLLRAFEISKRAARSGFEWPDIEAVFEKLAEEEAELREALALKDAKEIESEVGDLLFTAVNVARWSGVEPEDALRKMLDRFTARFMAMEAAASKPLRDLSAQEWDDLWTAAKVATAVRD
jgi:tetrapyrrole methylase family protein / MazG family protein